MCPETNTNGSFSLTRRALSAGLLASTATPLGFSAAAQEAKEFYRGKVLHIVVGFPPGGGFDLYARLVAEYLPRHMPVEVHCVVENMPGASTARAAAYIYGSAPQDGTVFGICHQGLLANQALGIPNAGEFDVLKFNWIGRMGTQLNVGIVWHTAGVRSLEDCKNKEVIFGATAPTATSVMIPKALNYALGTKFKIVPGYSGSADLNMAMERGEIHGFATGVWIDLLNTHANWMSEKIIFPLFQVGVNRNPALPDVPTVGELGDTQDERQILSVLGGTEDMGRAFMTGPKVPLDRVALLREAFSRMMKDPELLKNAEERNLEIYPMDGADLQKFVTQVGALPKEVSDKARKLLMR